MKIIGLCGKSGSGKDTIVNRLAEEYPDKFHKIVLTSTRPRRKGKDNYHFVTEEEFNTMYFNHEFLTVSCFNSWHYGVQIADLASDKVNIGAFDLVQIHHMLEKDIDLTVYEICATDKTRLIRSLKRELEPDINEIFRRYQADEKDFKNQDKFMTLVNEEPFDLEYNIEYITGQII